jgi:predicted O-methyltransferase YrrM
VADLPAGVALPTGVAEAVHRADEHGFRFSCEPPVGRLLATLCAAVPPDGRILELGTGAGVGTAWLVHGLGGRTDARVLTVEKERSTAALAGEAGWPAWVDIRVGDALDLLPTLGRFDLVFADAQGGKWTGLDRTIAALAPGGVLLVDDMDVSRSYRADFTEALDRVRRTILGDPRLVAVELPVSSGLILATRRHDG